MSRPTRPVRAALVLVSLLAVLPVAAEAAGRPDGCGTRRGGARDALWAHAERVSREGTVRVASAASTFAVADIAVFQDEGDLALVQRPLDLQGAGLVFTPAGGGYVVSRADHPLASEGTTRVSLGDDATQSVRLPFPFPFYSQSYSDVFVNSDGNLTFGAGDSASTSRSVGRMVSGPPRIGVLFSDLDPSAGGSVATRDEGDRFLVTWTDVPQYDRTDRNSVQVALYRDGRIEFTYGPQVSADIAEGVVGIAPGRDQGPLTAVDFSAAAGVNGAGALIESFREEDELDEVALARRFYRTYRDDFQQLVVFTNQRFVGRGVFAYERSLKNSDTGIGLQRYDFSDEYGSAGRLESFVMMDRISKYPADVNQPAAGEESTLSVLGQEAGHRWLANARFKDGANDSDELLGRDDVHWNFFLDTDGSHLEGNDIEDLGGGRFRTVGAGRRYSPLDQYLMGLRAPEQVGPFFLVREAVVPRGTTDRSREPETGMEFDGKRKDVTLQDVIAALGPRNPRPGPRPPWRQAFIFVSVGAPDPALIERVERVRAAWEPFFSVSTDGLGTVDTRLN